MLFDIFSGFEGAQYTIEGASYTADELKEKQEEFTPQNAKKQLIELIKEREKHFRISIRNLKKYISRYD